jgi:alpha-D-xyloside xylohydrolase
MFILESNDGVAIFESNGRRLRLGFLSAEIVRVTYTEGRPFQDRPSRIVTATLPPVAFQLRENSQSHTLSTGALTVVLDKQTGALSYMDAAGKTLLREPQRGGRWLTAKEVRRNIFSRDASVALAQSVDGVRAAATSYESVFDRMAFEAKLEFEFEEDEALFGFGSHEEGYGNLRGRSRELYQQNMKAVVPYFVSTRGYSVLFDCASLMTFHDDALGSYWWADVVDDFDFYVICGESFDDITRSYHRLTGKAPMPPKWAFGYVQSKERYVNAREMVDVVREYRHRGIPLDAIVLDWKSWPNGSGWGQKTFDPIRFPDPESFTKELHAMGARLMVSIWPIMTGGCENQREMLDRNFMLGNQATYDAFIPEARECYWEQARRGLFSKGVDSWWCDCTEPFEADWGGAVKPEPHTRLNINTGVSKLYLDAGEINAYSLLHSRGIYEGQRSATSAKRVVNLTRSSYAGQHRYGTITWNGDICGTWETLRRCIPEGVNFCATGEPYWTVDIGGFFVDNNPDLWFWRGAYSEGCRGLTDMNALEPDPNDTGCRDLGYWELYTRWLQYAVFLPMFRSHGTDAAREVWRFGEQGTRFYDIIARYIRLRYELMPYIYSMAAQVTLNSYTLMRAVALEFPEDRATHDLTNQYLFGSALLVCPVTEPMYYATGSKPISGTDRSRPVYLPAGCGWFDFWTGKLYLGGQITISDAPLETIPLYVRAGSILPMTQVMQFVDEVPDAPYEIRVYTGADALFLLYEDAGDGYDYEQGAYALVTLQWLEGSEELTILAREGGFATLVENRDYHVVFISELDRRTCTVHYTGEELRIKRNSANENGNQL